MNFYKLCHIYFTGTADREGGTPLELIVESSHPNGFTGKRTPGINKFFAPCVFYSSFPLGPSPENGDASSAGTKKVIDLLCCFALLLF